MQRFDSVQRKVKIRGLLEERNRLFAVLLFGDEETAQFFQGLGMELFLLAKYRGREFHDFSEIALTRLEIFLQACGSSEFL